MQHKIDSLKDRIGFERFELDYTALSEAQQRVLAVLPKAGQRCRVRRAGPKTASAYCQMWEFAVIGGYMQSVDGVKALVLFTEREDADTDELDWAFVCVSSIREFKPERVKTLKL